MSESVRFLEHDTVTDRDGNSGTVVKCFNKRTREYFLGIRVAQGPKKGQWDQLYRYTPVLDHAGGTLRTACLDCGRSFLATGRTLVGDRLYPVQDHCRTCYPAACREDHARATEPHIRNLGAYLSGNRSGVPAPARHTPEDLAAAAEQRRRDDDESPF